MIVPLLAAAAVAASADPAQRVAELQQIYAQSCEVRAYGAFDDLCDVLKRQMREAERAQRIAARARPAPTVEKPAAPAAGQRTIQD